MDLIFKCPNCDQELAVDSSAAGNEINCPSCNELIVIPEPEVPVAAPGAPPPAGGAHVEPHPVNPIDSSAARRVEMHLKVPVHDVPAESLIAKPLVPLEAAAAKAVTKRIRVKTIRHTDCIEVGHDRFDDIVTSFLERVGEKFIISITPLSYTFLDIGTQKLMTEYGVLIVYKG